MEFKVSPGGKLKGEIEVPGDKSISHRAVMIGALAKGQTNINNFLMGADCLSTIRCFEAMGVKILVNSDHQVVLTGKGLYGLDEPNNVLDVGNSGTTIRLLTGLLTGQSFCSILTGDDSIRKRPMNRVVKPLSKMGATIIGRQDDNLAPLAIRGGNLSSISYTSPVASAQVKSSIILAGLYADGETSIIEPAKSRDHTERMLQYFGADLTVDGNLVKVKGKPVLQGSKVDVPGDISSAAFFMVAALIVPGSELIIKNVGLNPTRDGIIEVLQKMGGRIEIIKKDIVSGEPVGDLFIKASRLNGIEIGGDIIPRLIDEVPILAVAAAYAEGQTIIKDAAELKVKESNRITTVAGELSKFGVKVTERSDGLQIEGGSGLNSTSVESHGDHRIAMAMAVAGLAAEGETTINGWECVDVSFPNFYHILKKTIG